MKLERVVIGTDFSAPSVDAARWAARHFARGAELVLAHVISIPEPPPIMRGKFPRHDLLVDTVREGAEKRLKEISLSLAAERVWLEIREGRPVETLTAIADEYTADVVVAGAHGERPGLQEGLGSTAEHLIRASARPVLLVPRPRETAVSHILVALDKPGTAPHALQWASVLSARYEATVTVMHVVTSGVSGGALAAAAVVAGAVPVDLRAQRALAEDRGQWRQLAVDAGVPSERASSEVASGVPAAEILSATERLQVDLVVMGRQGTGKVRRAVLGSVVEGVLRDATCPVLVVPE